MTAGPPPTLDYGLPPAASGRPWWVMPRLAVVLMSAAFFFQISSGFVVYRFEAMFKDFNVKLPGTTVLYLNVARWWQQEYGWAVGWGLALAVAISALAWTASHPRPGSVRPLRWGRAVMLVVLVFILISAVTVLAVFMPMITLIEGITNKPGGK